MQVPPVDWSTGRAAGPAFFIFRSCPGAYAAGVEPTPVVVRHRAMQMPRRFALAPALLAAVSLLAACTAGTGTPGAGTGTPPAGTPGSSPTPSLPFIDSPAAAASLVAATMPMFAGIGPKDPNLIGQSSWYEAAPLEVAKPPVEWRVTFRVGWGDCPSGCIDEHTWTFTIGVDESVTLVGETGPEAPQTVIDGLLQGSTGATGVTGSALAGPVCPVERPNDSACSPRAVEGAVLIVRGVGDTEIARVTTDGSGQFRIDLQPGSYTLEPQPVDGLMGIAAPMPFTVTSGAETHLAVAYDTGIR